jgi:hypothetical protein
VGGGGRGADRSGALSKERRAVVRDVVEQERSGVLSKERSVVVRDVVEQIGAERCRKSVV